MDSFTEQLVAGLICVIAAKVVDELADLLKEKASKKRGKHSKKP